MKKALLIVLVTALSVSVFPKSAVKPPAKKTAPAPVVKPEAPRWIDIDVLGVAYYYCETCKIEHSAAGKCKVCKADLERKVRSWSYMCPKCGYPSEKEGKCALCSEPMSKYKVVYLCLPCHVSSGEPGRCPTCRQELKKIKLQLFERNIKNSWDPVVSYLQP